MSEDIVIPDDIDTEQKKLLLHLVYVAKEYERHMKKLLKALAIVRTEAHYINLLTGEDWKIAKQYNLFGFWGSKEQMIVNGIDISEFAHAALLQLAVDLPELYKSSRVKLESLPSTIGKGGTNVFVGRRLAGWGLRCAKLANLEKSRIKKVLDDPR